MGKIIYHHRTRANGAEGVHIRGIQSGFRELGYEIVDISLFQIQSETPTQQAISRQGGIKRSILNVIASYLPNSLFKILEILYNLRTFMVGRRTLLTLIIQHNSPELIYERYAYFSFAMAFLAHKYHIPFVLEANTTCLDYDVRAIRLRWLARKIERYVFHQATLLVVVSTYLKEKIRQEYGIPEQRIIVTPNAINPKEFALEEQSQATPQLTRVQHFAQGKIIIGFVGMFVPWHGLDFLLEVFIDLLHHSSRNSPIGLLLVGDGPIRPMIEEKIKAAALIDNVCITGIVPHGHVKYFLDRFDIAIMPDSNPFGSPMKIFEYMAMGKPVVAPAYGPILEIITHRETGFLFKPKDKDDCLGAIQRLIENPDLKNQLGRTARHLVLTKHTWQHNVEKILQQLKQIRKGLQL